MLPGASYSPSLGDSRASRVWPGENWGCGDSKEEAKQLHPQEFEGIQGPSTRRISGTRSNNHLMSPGKLKSRICACMRNMNTEVLAGDVLEVGLDGGNGSVC